MATSHGNLHHFSKIFDALLRRHPATLIDFVVCQDNATRLVDYMLPYLRESPVMSSMLSVLFWPMVHPDIKVKRSEAFARLAEGGWIERIVGFLEFKGWFR